jgi:GNAT superfamily N-acetyltransferase
MRAEENIVIRNYNKRDLERLGFIVQNTIKRSYMKFYPKEAIDYFLELHSIRNMKKDIPKGHTFVLESGNEVLATGSIVENEIKRVFVLPEYQGRGFGKKIMAKLEEIALNEGFNKVKLCASLPSKDFYLSLDYEIVQFNYIEVKNNKKLEYYDMEKDSVER